GCQHSSPRDYRRLQACLCQCQGYVQCSWLMFDSKGEAAFLKHFQHRSIVGKDLCGERLKPCLTANLGEMPHQACATHDSRPTVLLDFGDESHVVEEVDIQEICDFLFRELALQPEETTIKRLGAAPAHRF